MTLERMQDEIRQLQLSLRETEGLVAAQQALINSLVSAAGLSMPMLLPMLCRHLSEMQHGPRSQLHPDALSAFDKAIAATRYALKVMQG